MKQVLCVFALGVSLSACAAYDPGYYEEYGYYGYGGRPGRYVRDQQCYEVRTTFQHPYVECRYVNRWKPEYKPVYKAEYRDKKRWRDDDDDDDDYYSHRKAKKRWKEYYD